MTHSQRQINISLCSKVKNLKTRRTENRQLSNVTYDLMLIEYSKHRAEKENPNIHSKHGHSSYRKENAAEFYEHIAKTFVQRYYQDRQTPYQFDFTFKNVRSEHVCPKDKRVSKKLFLFWCGLYLKRANEIFLFDVGVVKVDEFVRSRELHLF